MSNQSVESVDSDICYNKQLFTVTVFSLRQPIPVSADKSPLQLPSHHDTVSSSDDEDDDGSNGVHVSIHRCTARELCRPVVHVPD